MMKKKSAEKRSAKVIPIESVVTPFQVINTFFGELKLPLSDKDFKKLQQAFLDLDLRQLSTDELSYIRNLFLQLLNYGKAVEVISLSLRLNPNSSNWSPRKV